MERDVPSRKIRTAPGQCGVTALRLASHTTSNTASGTGPATIVGSLGALSACEIPKAEIARWFGTCTDIQEIVEAREVLANSREQLEAKFKSAHASEIACGK